MVDEIVPASWFAEAANMDTPAARLAELGQYESLHLLVAANPASPEYVLARLNKKKNPVIRRAIAQNPNAPLSLLCQLAAEFPEEFLSNPLIPMLNMTQPDFIKRLPLASWRSLLRFADLSPTWFQHIKSDKSYQHYQSASWELMQLHVSQVNKNKQKELLASRDVRSVYQKQLPESDEPLSQEEVELFLLFVLLFPYIAPMLKQQWVAAARVSPGRVATALALTREIGAKTPGLLAQVPHPFVLNQLARHPATPSRVLKQLALYNQRVLAPTRAQKAVRYATASNPRTPLASLYRLISAEEPGLRRIAATHPSLETLDREILALDQDATVRAALATLPGLAAQLFAQLANDPAPVVRAALARNLQIPLTIINDLARDPEPMVRAAAAGNPRLPSEAQATLLIDPTEMVRASLSGNARLSEDHAQRLALDPSPSVRAYLAANPRTPASLLAMLLRAEEPEIWSGLARHPKLPPELLAQLARQGDQRTRIAVAAHTRTPVETLAELAQENTHALWCALASNPNTPLNILEQAIHTSSLDLLYRLIQHPAMKRAKQRPFLALLAERLQPLIAANTLPSWLRRAFLQYYTALPLEVVALFAISPHWQERYLVAKRAHLPEPLLKRLAQDGICHVKFAALAGLEQHQNVKQRETH